MGSMPLFLPWAVHISDGVLSWPWWAGGLALAALLALAAAYRVRDEEVPRIALLAAAFFVASLMHVRAGPTSVHLILNGLVGVLLGRRCPLAILLGVALQAVHLGHGGFTTIGINACVMTLPALLAGGLFALLQRVRWVRHPWFRALLVFASAVPWMLSLLFSLALLFTNRITHVESLSVARAVQLTFHPATLAAVGLTGVLLALLECRLDNAPEFPLGLLVGVLAVLLTAALNALVLVWGGAADWHAVALLVFVAHMPVVVIEGVVVGFAVGFLARVKPEMLGDMAGHWQRPPAPPANGIVHPAHEITTPRPPVLLLALLATLLTAGTARAHRLEADYEVLADRTVKVESWFESGDSPKAARVQVFRPDGSVLTEGKLNDKGVFAFHFPQAEPLRVVVSTVGHRAEFTIPPSKLERAVGDDPPSGGTHAPRSAEDPFADRSSRVSMKDVLVGVGFLLALAAFVLSLRNARQLREMTRRDRQTAEPRDSGAGR